MRLLVGLVAAAVLGMAGCERTGDGSARWNPTQAGAALRADEADQVLLIPAQLALWIRRRRDILHLVTQEPTDVSDESSVENVSAAGLPARVGWYRYYFADERWEWSPQVARMHGYEPGTVDPTTELVLSHKHPDDRGQVAAMLSEARRGPKAFSNRHRIFDAQGNIHEVVVVGDQLADDDRAVVGTHGFYVDVTPLLERAHQEVVSEAVAEIAEARGPIEQAKGMLMLIYRIDADAAFELLKWRSQETNVKLRVIAEQLVADFLSLDYDEALPERVIFDRLLLTVHLRATS